MQKTKNISDFFSSRKSISVKNLKYPGPNKNQTMAIFKNALRVPDHGKLEPWRIVVISEDFKKKYISILEERGKKLHIDPLKIGFSGLLIFILAVYALDSIHLRDCMDNNLNTFDVEMCVENKIPDY